jgi:TPR repeat protein
MNTITTKDADVRKHQCAACGDSDYGGGSLKACTGCNLVKYCNRTCQVAHRPAHKKACKTRLAELFDKKLFQQPPPNEDCPICYLRLPIDGVQNVYQSCCGKMLCGGCVYANTVAAADTERFKCVFCRTELPSSDEEDSERMKKRMEANDVQAMANLGSYYQLGMMGLRQDNAKALELYQKSATLGHNFAHYNLSVCYQEGGIVETDTRKAIHHRQLAAMAGNTDARYNLGCDEYIAGNMDRAYKHWMISANDGHDLSMKSVHEGNKSGHVKKDDYAKTTRAYGNSIDEMKSDDRDRSAAACRASWAADAS